MSSSVESKAAVVISVHVTKDALTAERADGRTFVVPLAWYPRLVHATARERSQWRLISNGRGIHGPRLDEDISVQNLLAGKASGESFDSFQRWVNQRAHVKKQKLQANPP